MALWPPGANFEKADFDWRISRAAVEEDGPFSSFLGFDRVLVVTAGAGLVLDHGPAAPRAQLERLVPYRFSGDRPTRAELVAGRVEDFNVLCRRGRVRAEVEVWTGGFECSLRPRDEEQLFLHLLEGKLESSSIALSAGESLWWQHPDAPLLTLWGHATALLVRLRSQR